MEVDITDLKSVTPAMVKYLEENDLEKLAQYQAAVAGVAQVKTALGALANSNAREFLRDGILLAVVDALATLDIEMPNPADVESFRAAHKVVDESPSKAAIVGE